MLSHGDTPICQNLVCLCQRTKTSCETQNYGENISFWYWGKGQGHTDFMNVRDTSYHDDILTCQTKYDYVKRQKSWGLNTKPCHKPYNPYNGQCRIRIMNVLYISTRCAKYGMPMSKLTDVTGRTWRHDKSL